MPNPLSKSFTTAAIETRTFARFRQIAFAEAVSYLLLLFVAMPLKYGLGWEPAVKVVGWAHGVLFLLYGLWLLQCWQRYRWPFRIVALAALASLLPAGPLVMDRRLPLP